MIEVSLENGRLVLNSANANYSYGSLFAIFKKSFEAFQLSFKDKTYVLMLGLGGGSVVKYLASKFNHLKIDAVELDPVIIDVANTYFELASFKNISTICEDASVFVEKTTKKYDLILIDLFIDTAPPSFCLEAAFIDAIAKCCTEKTGEVIFNKSMTRDGRSAPLHYQKHFKNIITKNILNNQLDYYSNHLK